MAPDCSMKKIPEEFLVSLVPILAQLPKFVDFSAYLEFGDSEIPQCEKCNILCEFAYFKLLQFNSQGLEICGSCLEKKYKTRPWTLHVRNGLIHYLVSLNALIKQRTSAEPPVELGVSSKNAEQVPLSSPLRFPSELRSLAQYVERHTQFESHCPSQHVEMHSPSESQFQSRRLEPQSSSKSHIQSELVENHTPPDKSLQTSAETDFQSRAGLLPFPPNFGPACLAADAEDDKIPGTAVVISCPESAIKPVEPLF